MLGRALVSVALLIAALAPPDRALAQTPEQAAGDGALAEYRIGPDDVLDIVVWNNTAISRAVPVRPDGKISLPLLNDVRAAGLTPTELRDILMKKLVEYIPIAEVSVIVREVRSFKVSILGKVEKPGRYELKAPTTVLDALAIAGPFNEFASRGRIVIARRENGKVRRIPFSYDKVFNGEQENFYLQPGDIILVP